MTWPGWKSPSKRRRGPEASFWCSEQRRFGISKNTCFLFFKHIKTEYLSTELAFAFLNSTGLKLGTEGFLMAAQDHVCDTLISTRKFLRAPAELADTVLRHSFMYYQSVSPLPNLCTSQGTIPFSAHFTTICALLWK